MKKKVMHIVQSPGGVERYILMLLKNMDLSKYDNILVCSFDYDEEKFKDIVIAFEQVDMVREISFRKDISSIINVRRIIKKYNPDVVYMHSSKAGAIGRVANIGLKNKSIYNPHGWAFNMECSKKKKLIYICIEKALAYFCDNIVAISEYEKESAIENRICDINKIQVIFNGIDIKEYERSSINKNQFKINNRIPKESLVIGMVGRISKQKSPDIFIKAALKIKQQVPNAFFVIVGDGEERNYIEDLIKEVGLQESVLITGWVKNSYEYIKSFDVAMLLSRWEGFGLAIVEYMICEVPVIATDVDAIPNLITNNRNGVLVKVDDVNETFDACMKILNNNNFKKSIVKNAKNIVLEKFNIERVVYQHNQLFES